MDLKATAYVFTFIMGFLSFSCKTTQMTYQSWLNSQVKEWKKLDPELIEAYQKFYDVPLEKVLYSENISLKLSFDAVTFDNKIYFKKKLLRKLLAHELEHVEQYRKNPFFLEEYVIKGAKSVLQKGQSAFKISTIHENIELEQAAIEKANSVWKSYKEAKDMGK